MKIQRFFFIGDEWLYYKIYCGPKTADSILKDVIQPITNSLKANNEIDKWFFIRYSDPKNHLRVRFHLTSKNSLINIITMMNKALQEYVWADLVWNINIDTYKREIERYGINTIKYAEDIFCNDSDLTINILSMIGNDVEERKRWIIGLLSIDTFIDDFGYSLDKKVELIELMKETFTQEFNLNKGLKIQLDNKYRQEHQTIESILNIGEKTEVEYQPIIEAIRKRSEANKSIIEHILEIKNNNNLEKPLNEYMWSYLHMINNRLFRTQQRTHELVMYYLLFKYYKSKLARMRVSIS